MSINRITSVHYIAAWLRKLHLLQTADYLMYIGDVMRHSRANREFKKSHPEFVPPPSGLAYDAYGHTNWRGYNDSGMEVAKIVSSLINEYVVENRIKICEWGCGPARVIRHLGEMVNAGSVELYGTDYNRKTIRWCQQHIHGIHFTENKLVPPLPFMAEFFDCVYALSVFTHLSENLHYAWIEELFRTIKPGGILIFTTHGDLCACNLLPADRKIYEAGNLVVRDQVREGQKHFLAYQPPQFIRDHLLKGHTVLKHVACEDLSQVISQDIWVVRKAAS